MQISLFILKLVRTTTDISMRVSWVLRYLPKEYLKRWIKALVVQKNSLLSPNYRLNRLNFRCKLSIEAWWNTNLDIYVHISKINDYIRNLEFNCFLHIISLVEDRIVNDTVINLKTWNRGHLIFVSLIITVSKIPIYLFYFNLFNLIW